MTDMQKVRAAFRWLRWAIQNGVLRSNAVKLHDGPNRAMRRAGLATPARLDADRSAEPLTKIVGARPANVCSPLIAAAHVEGDVTTPLAETPRERKNRLARERRAARKAEVTT